MAAAAGLSMLSERQLAQQQQLQEQQALARALRRQPTPGGGRQARGAPPSDASAAASTAAAGPAEVHLDFAASPVLLDEELISCLVGIAGLRHLNLVLRDGSASNMCRLSELTGLTHLDLQCRPECRPRLGATAAAGPAEVHLDFAASPVLLDEELISCLVGIAGLRHLNLVLRDGSASNMCRLSELTGLTHLDLQCRPECRPRLGAWDVYGLATACAQLHTLVLHLSADCLSIGALEALQLAPCLAILELCAHPVVQETPYGRWEVRARLLEVAVQQCIGGGEDEGASGVAEAGGSVASNGGGAAAEVGRALEPLMFLQQVLQAVPLEEVKQTLEAEAEWRERQAQMVLEEEEQQQQPQEQQEQAQVLEDGALVVPLAGLAVVDGPAAAVDNGPAAAAGDGPVAVDGPADDDGPAAGDDPAVAAGDGAAAAAGDGAAAAAATGVGAADNTMPTLAAWALLPPEEEGPDAAAFAAASMFIHEPIAPAPQPPAIPLHLLTQPQLAHLRTLLVREELVTGPCFNLERYVPLRTRRLILRGFGGICVGGPAGRRLASSLPSLETLEAALIGANVVEAAREAVAGWVRDGSRAPRLRAVSIEEVSG
ncbi:hypothetical protein TSOC_001920 [Tetrabaena socialis]|uniref:Uncharacterized protein n=1 Tax=Tetrabaena socialis TaxID=47790 RepID=A0A2J8AFG9_9CHLO|nr:hypothetical protein TSOC_001920 [Tetrabaena socialis]|eukprot:PNH11268.1 hypothetical protein TSOC_001920 [Tetrabaena socialis]